MGDAALQDEIDAALTPRLPIEAKAREMTLLVADGSGLWHAREQFPLER